jgi:hypothetical protein
MDFHAASSYFILHKQRKSRYQKSCYYIINLKRKNQGQIRKKVEVCAKIVKSCKKMKAGGTAFDREIKDVQALGKNLHIFCINRIFMQFKKEALIGISTVVLHRSVNFPAQRAILQ